MLLPLSLAAWVLAAPPPLGLLDDVPKRAVFHALPGLAPGAGRELTLAVPAGRRTEPDSLWGWLDQLAVVRPHRPDRYTPPSLQMFIALSTMRGGVGVRAFGSF